MPNEEGCLSTAEEMVRDALAASARFLSWSGAANASEAKAERIHVGDLPAPGDGSDAYSIDELNDYRPYALVFIPEQGLTWIRQAEPASYAPGTVRVGVQFHQDTPSGRNHSYVYRQFSNDIGIIISEALDYASMDAAMATLDTPPTRSHWKDYEERGDYLFALVTFTLGNR